MAKKKNVFLNLQNNELTHFRELTTEELRWTCPTDIFKFKDTSEVAELSGIVGQPRAVESIKIGAKVNAKGFNIFVTGLAGTGRLSTVKTILEEVDGFSNEFFDFCYVHNFQNADKPILLKIKQGEGKKLAKAMDESIAYLRRRLPILFDEDDYQNAKRKLTEQFHTKEMDLLSNFDEKIKPFNFIRGQYENEQGMVIPDVFPLIDGKPVHIDAIDGLVQENKLNADDANKLKETYEQFHQDIFNLSRLGVKLLQEYKNNVASLDRATSEIIVNSAFKDLEESFDSEKVHLYIESVKDNIINNLKLFVKSQDQLTVPQENEENIDENDNFNIYKVNVIIDNSERTKPPIVVETTPSYTNLFGTIEKVYDKRGFWKTDFTKIKAGSLLKADQGYLIVNADDLFLEAGVWQNLKRVLLYNKLEMQPYETYFQISQSYLKPEPIEINCKVIIIGGQTLYYMLTEYEKGFKKIFKINAKFDFYSQRNQELIENYTKFVAQLCNTENLPHLTPDGMAAVVEWAAEFAGSQNKLTLKFSDLADIIRESSYYIDCDTKNICRESIEKAIKFRRYRNNLIDEKIKQEILDGDIMVATDGYRIGQINGLTIYDDGIFSFGKPARITSTVSVGNSGIINVEREASMSGSIHNKAVLIISGFLRERFAQKFPLSLTASIAFEQSYGGIDGDSASCAEIYVLLSAISGQPINQSFALTGSMNQKGDVQPIGGVNEKLRGFWEICKEKGLTGKQGVIIPEQNVKDLMLPKEMIEDVKNGAFKIYSISRIEQGIPLLFGIEAGELNEQGEYPKESLFGKVYTKLEELYKISRPKRDEHYKELLKKKKLVRKNEPKD
jgi:ATP-dependent Lon protease